MYESMPEWRRREIDALVGKSHVIEYDYQRDPDRFRTLPPPEPQPCNICHHHPCRCELGGEG